MRSSNRLFKERYRYKYTGVPSSKDTLNGNFKQTCSPSGIGECMNACAMSTDFNRKLRFALMVNIQCSPSIDGVGDEKPKDLAVVPFLMSLATMRHLTLSGLLNAATQRHVITRMLGYFCLRLLICFSLRDLYPYHNGSGCSILPPYQGIPD